MGAAAAPLLAESVMAESFAVAAPSMFTAVELAPLAAPTFGGLSALGAEFGTAGLLAEAGTNASILSALGSGAGASAVPTLAEGIASGVTTGGLGAGELGINEALVNAEQMQAANSGFSQAELDAMQRGQEMAQNARELGQVAETGTDATSELIQRSQVPTTEIPGEPFTPAVENAQGLEQIKELPLSETEWATTHATSEEFANAELQAEKAKEIANYEETIQNLSKEATNKVNPVAQDEFTQAQVRRALTGEGMNSGITQVEVAKTPFSTVGNTPTQFAGNVSNFGANPANVEMLRPYTPYDMSFGAQNAVPGGAGLPSAMTGEVTTLPAELGGPTTDPLSAGFSKALDFAKNNPFSAASMAYTAKSLLGKKEEEDNSGPAPYNGILSRYKMSNDFKGRHVNPESYQYATKTYADGGIASFRSGGKSDSLDPTGGSKIAGDYYESMLREQARNMPSTHSDPGIYYDLDPDTRYLDPVTAAQVRMAKINKRSNIQAANMKRPMGLGQINLSPPGGKAQESGASTDAAHGGIMHANLGSYAAGGNPRLLRGPGDGMSDNIPATIAGKQPARLADGEFVVPADVVSHLGNGSTEAGAKILHEMMNKVRQARTGNSKQGKQINPRKFVPA